MSSPIKPTIGKPVTSKDIADLYSDLQIVIDKVPKSPKLEQTRSFQDRSRSTALPLSSNPVREASPRTDCPCRHIFLSNDSEYCALCDDKMPLVADKNKQIDELQQRLKENLDLVEKYQQDLQVLNKRVERYASDAAQTKEEHNALVGDLSTLEQKLALESKRADDAKQARSDLENELEELSQKLFEEANGMVASEKRAKHALEVRYNQGQEELKLCRAQMEADEVQLKELKLKLGEEQITSNHTSLKNEEAGVDKMASQDLKGLFKAPAKEKELGDDLVFNEFKEFVNLGGSVPIRKLNTSTDYMKNSFIEDVEPCLRFGPQPRLSAKKLCDAIIMNTCFIEEAPYGFMLDQGRRLSDTSLRISASKNMIWDRFSGVPSATEGFCQACGRKTKYLPYRFRISMIDDWACIDRYCRDRMVSVCEFYVFIRNIRQGYYNGRTIPDLYQESLRLKLQMFYARMGELSPALVQLGIKGDIIGHASEPNMVIPPPVNSTHPRNSVWW